MISTDSLLLLCLLIPLAGAVLIGRAGRHPNLRETITFVTAGLLLACVIALIGPVMQGDRPEVVLAELKASYYQQQVRNLDAAVAAPQKQLGLFGAA